MPKCLNCGAFITTDFARVFGDNDGGVYGCLECHDLTEVARGAAAEPGEAAAGGVSR